MAYTLACKLPVELNLTFASARDDSGGVSEGDYRVVALPTTVFVTAAGKIAHVQIGQLTNEQIETYSRRLIAGAEIVP